MGTFRGGKGFLRAGIWEAAAARMAGPTQASSDRSPGGGRLRVGVVLERRALANPWATESWRVVEVLPGVAAPMPWTVMSEGEGRQRVYAGDLELELFRSDTEGYRDNLASARPTLWVVLRRGGTHGIALHAATVDPREVEAHSDAGDDLIEPVPLPTTVMAWMQAFIERHHVERPFWKRKRDRADPEALARRRRPLGEGTGRHG
jgi:hypothetical protein